jgi:hypothetical protein
MKNVKIEVMKNVKFESEVLPIRWTGNRLE